MAQRKTPGLIKRGEVWHIDKIVDGQRLVGTTGTSDRTEAERYLAHRISEHRRVHRYGERPKVTMLEAANKYLEEYAPARSADRAANCLANVLAHIDEIDVTAVHDGVLEEYRAARREAGASAGTINLELMYVTRVLNLAARVWRHQNGRPYIDTAPLLRREVGEVVHKPYPLSWDEQRRLFAGLPAYLAEMALFAVNAGLRQEELCGLKWAWRVKVAELSSQIFILPDDVTKNGRERVVVLNSIAQRIVQACEGRNETYVFVGPNGRIPRMNGNSWRKARAAAGLECARVHDLRHTFGHRLRAAGVSYEDRQDLLGHANGKMTTHYSAPDLRRLMDAAELIVAERPTTILRAVS